jgi:hypothetical protein
MSITPWGLFNLFKAVQAGRGETEAEAEQPPTVLLPDRAIVQIVLRRMQGGVKVGELTLPEPLVLCEQVEDERTVSLGEMVDRAVLEAIGLAEEGGGE